MLISFRSTWGITIVCHCCVLFVGLWIRESLTSVVLGCICWVNTSYRSDVMVSGGDSSVLSTVKMQGWMNNDHRTGMVHMSVWSVWGDIIESGLLLVLLSSRSWLIRPIYLMWLIVTVRYNWSTDWKNRVNINRPITTRSTWSGTPPTWSGHHWSTWWHDPQTGLHWSTWSGTRPLLVDTIRNPVTTGRHNPEHDHY